MEYQALTAMEMLERYSVEVLPSTFTDDSGRVWPTPQIVGRLKFTSAGASIALRRTVFIRDGFTCQDCGARPSQAPTRYDGRHTVGLGWGWCLLMDHILSRRNGGAHHPDNLRTLCSRCNQKKVSAEDRPIGLEIRRCG